MTTRNPFAKDLPDAADECAHTALSLIYRRERDEARERLEDVVAEYQKAGKSWDAQRVRLTAELTEARKALARVLTLCDAGIDLESADKVRAAMNGKP